MGFAAPGAIAAVAAAAVAVVAGAADGKPQPLTGWDGTNPFRCELQQAAFRAVGPHPEADPYCIEFDKRRQNVTQLGVAQFLAAEPARVAAALPKCFYYQSDRWRGSVVQDNGATKTYEWDGHYFFDKARGELGVWATNFNVNGRPADLSGIPGWPRDIARYLGPGTGGFVSRNEIEVDPACAARARREGASLYVPAAGDRAGQPCPSPAGRVGRRRLGPVTLGMREGEVRRRLGPPVRVHRGFLRYCVLGGGRYLVGQRGDRSGDYGADPDVRSVMLITTHPGHRLRGVGPGAHARVVRRAFPRSRLRFSQRSTRVVETSRHSGVVLGIRGARVRYVGVYDRLRLRTDARLRDFLRRAL